MFELSCQGSLLPRQEVTELSVVINPEDQGALGLLLTKLGRAGKNTSRLTSSAVGSSTFKKKKMFRTLNN